MAKQYPVITISREYAAYGRTVAAALSERLGLPYYDKDFVKETAKQSGYSEEEILKEGESMSWGSKFMNSLLNNANSYTSSYDAIYKAQKEVILNLAKEPCIIVGRCADHILGEAGIDSFDIYLYADMEHRMIRARELNETEGEDLKKSIEKIDTLRSIYYKKYTGKDSGHCSNYNICLDTGRIGVEKCVDLICEILNQ